MANKRKYLTVQEFITAVKTAPETVFVHTKKFGNFRCRALGTSVVDLIWNPETGDLSWSDEDGDPSLSDLTPDTVMIDVPNCSKYSTSTYVELNRKGEVLKSKKNSDDQYIKALSIAFGEILKSEFGGSQE